jgi:hypothetical protein
MADEDPCQKPKPQTAEKPLQSPDQYTGSDLDLNGASLALHLLS